MSEENEKIFQEPKVAMQIISKILQSADGKGVTVNVITIGKLVVTMNGHEFKTEGLEAIEAKIVEGQDVKVLFQTELPSAIYPNPLLTDKPKEIENDKEMSFPRQKRRSPEDAPYSELINNVLRTEHPDWKDHSIFQSAGHARRFFRYLFKKRGMFRLEEIGKDDLVEYLKSRVEEGNKITSARAEKYYLLGFFKDLEKQGIGKAIPRFILHGEEGGKSEEPEEKDFSFPV